MKHSRRGVQSARHRSFRVAGLLVLSVFSLLMWSRLKMVTDTPRTVYAVPESAQVGDTGPAIEPGSDAAGSSAASPAASPVASPVAPASLHDR